MKKRIFVLIIVSLFILSGCNSTKMTETNEQAENKMIDTNKQTEDKMTGEYVLAGAKEKDKVYTQEEIEKIKNNYRIIVFDNNQAELYLNQKRYSVTYDENFFISQDNNEKDIRLGYKYNRNAITINYYSGVYVFKK